MTLCFAALIKILKICSKPRVFNKTLCGAVAKTIDEYYGNMLEADDGTVSHLLSCDYNLSPENIVEPAKKIAFSDVSKGMTKFVLPLLDVDKLPLGVLALRSIALSSVTEPDAEIGRMKRSTLESSTAFEPADFLANIFLYTAVTVFKSFQLPPFRLFRRRSAPDSRVSAVMRGERDRIRRRVYGLSKPCKHSQRLVGGYDSGHNTALQNTRRRNLSRGC